MEREREQLIKLLLLIFEKVNIQLKDIVNFQRGKVISKEYIENNKGIYPVYSSQTLNNGNLGSINTYTFDGEYLTWTTDGANAGTIFYRNEKFNITNVCGLIKTKEQLNDWINLKYLYFHLNKLIPNYVNRSISNAKLMLKDIININFVLPNINIQNKIANVLDNFEAICKDLNIGLPAEIDKREQQYEFYLNKIFDYFQKN
ncbi:restriction endonuclease subunit S [Mycoplasma sp. 744]|uniref:restriction endonuclease subunit S n=1 Tax=Mycoplasma sp. 744 TaxID=3108531 RepID=UPI002B1CEA2F|nr:restriction endonuclease subunit S [Mycoplasma sp. 744]MEA4115424.1 restriction endonuclease subunit S [Mycoplasma sp. 744]